MTRRQEIKAGFLDILPVLFVAFPIGLLWGTLAVGKGLSALQATLMSGLVFAGAAQFVAVDLWLTPVPWVMLTLTTLIVNIRHVLMGGSLVRHLKEINSRWYPFIAAVMVDESWALAERRALKHRLTLAYFFSAALPMWAVWTGSSLVGAWLGKSVGDPAAYGIDFAFSALFIAILSGFWRGSKTLVVLAVSGVVAAAAHYYIPGAWFIVLGGCAGVATAALMYRAGEAE